MQIPPVSIGSIIALTVLVLVTIFAALGRLELWLAIFFAGLAVARLT